MPDQSFEFHPAAISEAWAAYWWYKEQSDTAGEFFWIALANARERALKYPGTGGPYFHGTRCIRLKRFPFGLVYYETAERIVGVAVAHLKRRPGYWSERLT